MNDRTSESLLARRALAKKATPEKWNLLQTFAEDENYVGPQTWGDMGKAVCICRYAKDAQYIAANSPDVVMADIDEILRLREEIKRLECEADWLAERASATDCLMDDTVENCTKKNFPCVACFREAARKAVEENHD